MLLISRIIVVIPRPINNFRLDGICVKKNKFLKSDKHISFTVDHWRKCGLCVQLFRRGIKLSINIFIRRLTITSLNELYYKDICCFRSVIY